MCGRFTLTPEAERLFEEYGIGIPRDYEPRWNIAPGQPILALAAGEQSGLRAGWLLWGLVPPWQREGKPRPLVNLRAETVHKTASHLLESRRCAIPADGFYEWQRSEDGRLPFHLRRPKGELFTMAGLWNRTRAENGAEVHTVAILTTAPSPTVRPIHDRMPVILGDEARAKWLDRNVSADAARALLRTYDPGLEAQPVSKKVNDARYDAPDCIDPVD